MSYIGSTPTTQSFIAGTDYFNGDGSTTAFTLSRSVVSTNDIQATVNNVVQQPNTAYTVSGTTITFTSAPSAGTANIYVRYLSTTTQSITPSQGTVGNNQFANNISAIPMTYGTIGAGNASIMKNRIINGAMVIDQRNAGASVTPTSTLDGYPVDRFFVTVSQNSKLTTQQNAGSVTPPIGFSNYLGVTSSSAYTLGATDYFAIRQYIEGFNTADLQWGTVNAKTVTLSFQVYSSLTGTFGGAISNSAFNRSYPFTYTVSSANTWTAVSVTIAGDTSGTWVGATNGIGIRVQFGLGVGSTYSGTAGAWAGSLYISATGATSVVGTSGATFYITGVQLEVGSSATGFEYVNYQTSLANCQRYYAKMSSTTTYAGYGSGYCSSTSQANSYVKHSVPMRTAPTISQNNLLLITGGAVSAASSIANTYAGIDASTVAVNASSAVLVAGQGVIYCQNSGGSGYLDFSAEL